MTPGRDPLRVARSWLTEMALAYHTFNGRCTTDLPSCQSELCVGARIALAETAPTAPRLHETHAPETDAGALDAAWEALLDALAADTMNRYRDSAGILRTHRPLIEAAIRRDATPALDVDPERLAEALLYTFVARYGGEPFTPPAWEWARHDAGALLRRLRAAETPTPEGEGS